MGTKIGYFTWDWGKQNTQLTQLKTEIKEKHLKIAETVLHHNTKLNFDKYSGNIVQSSLNEN